MRHKLLCVLGLGIFLAGGPACGPKIDLHKLTVTDVFTGWYDAGVNQGLNKLVPSITFRLQNAGSVPANQVDLTVSFWQEGADGEGDAKEVTGIGSDTLAPGGSTAPILVRGSFGYTIDQPRDELFTHSKFKDFTAKLLAKRGGEIVPIGEFKIDRRILPSVSETPGRP